MHFLPPSGAHLRKPPKTQRCEQQIKHTRTRNAFIFLPVVVVGRTPQRTKPATTAPPRQTPLNLTVKFVNCCAASFLVIAPPNRMGAFLRNLPTIPERNKRSKRMKKKMKKMWSVDGAIYRQTGKR